MRPSDVLAGLKAYPFTRLTEAKRRLAEQGVEILDFGIGEPREEQVSAEALARSYEVLSELAR